MTMLNKKTVAILVYYKHYSYLCSELFETVKCSNPKQFARFYVVTLFVFLLSKNMFLSGL